MTTVDRFWLQLGCSHMYNKAIFYIFQNAVRFLLILNGQDHVNMRAGRTTVTNDVNSIRRRYPFVEITSHLGQGVFSFVGNGFPALISNYLLVRPVFLVFSPYHLTYSYACNHFQKPYSFDWCHRFSAESHLLLLLFDVNNHGLLKPA